MENFGAASGAFLTLTLLPLPPLVLFQQLGTSALQSGTFLGRQTVQTVLGNLIQQRIDLGCFVRGDFDRGRA